MCGIFGVLSESNISFSQLFQLGEINKRRGNLSFGYLAAKMKTTKSIVDTQIFRYMEPFNQALIPQNSLNAILAHIRAPTGVQTKKLTSVHPFEISDGYLAHNGLLLNHADYSKWCPNYNVDSQIIAGGIQHHLNQGIEIIQSIKKTIEPLEGQQACWYWHKPERSLYLWRVMAPIYKKHEKGKLCFSSVKCRYADSLLKEGIIYRYDFSLSNWIEADNFLFESAYINV